MCLITEKTIKDLKEKDIDNVASFVFIEKLYEKLYEKQDEHGYTSEFIEFSISCLKYSIYSTNGVNEEIKQELDLYADYIAESIVKYLTFVREKLTHVSDSENIALNLIEKNISINIEY